ncbi:MAG: hypothetical protein RR898_08650 [Clostridium sp.]|uniref:hypothetical protein n=3 Tax=Clostridium sp. TaxID=1506 RepID=UPI002FC716EE
MKKIISLFMILVFTLMLASCGGSVDKTEVKSELENQEVERITITNARYAGRYTIIDKKSMDRFVSYLEKVKPAEKSPGLEPDFIFEVYSGNENLGTYKYIAGVTDSEEGNLMDVNGKMYRITRNVEDIFMKRLMKKNDLKNVPEYYTSLINKIIEKAQIKPGSTVVVDIGKDYAVTKSITSVEQQSILESVKARDIKIIFPTDDKKYDHSIEIKTGKYGNTSCEAVVTVKTSDPAVKPIRYEVSGNYKSGDWEFHIKYK